MSVIRKEIKEFEKEVCLWLHKQGVILEDIIIESHCSMDGYVICWNEPKCEHVVFNLDEWNEYLSFHKYWNIRNEDLKRLKK